MSNATYMLQNATQNAEKITNIFKCIPCLYQCSRKSEMKRHYLTTKHQNATQMLHDLSPMDDYDNKISSGDKFTQLITTCNYVCDCGKNYKHHSSFYRHKIGCFMYVEQNKSENQILELSKENKSDFKEMVLLLLKENKEIQNNFMELIPYIKGTNTNSNNTITNNNTTNNNQFNVNMFLNEHCKNAMNLTDFIHSLPITNETYDDTIENGLTKTITSMVVNGLNKMDILERPIHCTDPARKIMYIKDNDVWEKDNELHLLLHGIKTLSSKQRTMINKWQDANVGWDNDDNLQTKLTTLICHSMTDIASDEKEMNKIFRAISKNTYLTTQIKEQYK